MENHANCKYLNQDDDNATHSRWIGKCSSGFVQGKGTMTFKTDLGESTILGTYEDGVLSGYIEESSWRDDGDGPRQYEYKGETRNGHSVGLGTYKEGDSFQYSGWLENSRFNGYGELKIVDTTYAGMFKDGGMNGLGVYTLEDAITLKGEFKNSQADGAGVLEWSLPEFNFKIRIVGVFKGLVAVPFDEFEVVGPAIMESEGKEKYRYTGEIFDFKMHGQGIQVYDTGHRHEGMFEKGRPHGPGIAIDPKGDSCEGEWKDGTLIGRGKGVSKDQSGPCLVDENGNVTLIIVG